MAARNSLTLVSEPDPFGFGTKCIVGPTKPMRSYRILASEYNPWLGACNANDGKPGADSAGARFSYWLTCPA